eukprot:TRINITY_DN9049_c0_g1_i5.p2 TRINITY_DN9049_c0_g1~~TRINITY_DN9049_c0_g1_i5.p2  ORF type:complete len:249 (-),score=79.79 TRINITY_DN9049_c0_g1_i5:117-863(-)
MRVVRLIALMVIASLALAHVDAANKDINKDINVQKRPFKAEDRFRSLRSRMDKHFQNKKIQHPFQNRFKKDIKEKKDIKAYEVNEEEDKEVLDELNMILRRLFEKKFLRHSQMDRMEDFKDRESLESSRFEDKNRFEDRNRFEDIDREKWNKDDWSMDRSLSEHQFRDRDIDVNKDRDVKKKCLEKIIKIKSDGTLKGTRRLEITKVMKHIPNEKPKVKVFTRFVDGFGNKLGKEKLVRFIRELESRQ